MADYKIIGTAPLEKGAATHRRFLIPIEKKRINDLGRIFEEVAGRLEEMKDVFLQGLFIYNIDVKNKSYIMEICLSNIRRMTKRCDTNKKNQNRGFRISFFLEVLIGFCFSKVTHI